MVEDIIKEMKRLQEEMNKIFSSFDKSVTSEFIQPLADLRDEGDKLVASIELPGVDKRDIKINITENSLEVKVEKKKKAKIKSENYIREERSYKGFYKAMTLPEQIIPEKTRAVYRDGILEIIMPKQRKTKKATTLKVD